MAMGTRRHRQRDTLSQMEVPMFSTIRSLLKDESGATAIEYALLAAGIALGIGTAASVVAPEITNIFDDVTDLLKDAQKK